jgi:hypothetical protein
VVQVFLGIFQQTAPALNRYIYRLLERCIKQEKHVQCTYTTPNSTAHYTLYLHKPRQYSPLHTELARAPWGEPPTHWTNTTPHSTAHYTLYSHNPSQYSPLHTVLTQPHTVQPTTHCTHTTPHSTAHYTLRYTVQPIAPRLQTCAACYCTEYCSQLLYRLSYRAQWGQT